MNKIAIKRADFNRLFQILKVRRRKKGKGRKSIILSFLRMMMCLLALTWRCEIDIDLNTIILLNISSFVKRNIRLIISSI